MKKQLYPKHEDLVPDADKVKEAVRKRSLAKNSKPLIGKGLGCLLSVLIFGAAIYYGYKFRPIAVPLEEQPVTSPAKIKRINASQSDFIAGPIKLLSTWKPTDLHKYLGGIYWTSSGERMVPCQPPEGLQNRQSFDARKKWPKCFNQMTYTMGACSSSWAIAAATTVANRACIVDPEKENLELSPQAALSCDDASNGCGGSSVDAMWLFTETKGLPTESCFPFTGLDKTKCSKQCKSNIPPVRTIKRCKANDSDLIMREIEHRGPVVALVKLSDDFLLYKNGLFKPSPVSNMFLDTEQRPILHTVKIIGWGVETTNSKREYWLIQGSGLGPDWGDNGVMKLDRAATKTLAFNTIVAPQLTHESINGLISAEEKAERDDWKRRMAEKASTQKAESTADEDAIDAMKKVIAKTGGTTESEDETDDGQEDVAPEIANESENINP